MGHSSSIFNEAWPIVNSEILTKKELNIACQVNGKLRGSFSISSNASEQEIIEEACIHAEKYIKNKKIIKTIYIKQKLVNIVTEDI